MTDKRMLTCMFCGADKPQGVECTCGKQDLDPKNAPYFTPYRTRADNWRRAYRKVRDEVRRLRASNKRRRRQ